MHRVTGSDDLAAEFHVLQSHPGNAHALAEGDVAQQLLQGPVQQRGPPAQLGELVGVGEQGVDDVADVIGGGVVPRDDQEHGQDGQLPLLKPLVADAGGGHRTDQVIARGLTPCLGQLREIGAQRRLRLGGRVRVGGAHRHHRHGPAAQLRAVRGGHVHQLADRHERQFVRQVRCDVGRRAVLGHRLQQCVHGPLGPWAQCLDLGRGEGFDDQPAYPVECGRVHQVDRLRLGDGRRGDPREVLADQRGPAEPPVRGDGLHVGVARDQPAGTRAVGHAHPGDGGLGAHPGHERIGFQGPVMADRTHTHLVGSGHPGTPSHRQPRPYRVALLMQYPDKSRTTELRRQSPLWGTAASLDCLREEEQVSRQAGAPAGPDPIRMPAQPADRLISDESLLTNHQDERHVSVKTPASRHRP